MTAFFNAFFGPREAYRNWLKEKESRPQRAQSLLLGVVAATIMDCIGIGGVIVLVLVHFGWFQPSPAERIRQRFIPSYNKRVLQVQQQFGVPPEQQLTCVDASFTNKSEHEWVGIATLSNGTTVTINAVVGDDGKMIWRASP